MADWYDPLFFLLLWSAERFNDRAIFFGSFFLKTFCSRSRALLCSVTLCDHFFFDTGFFAVLFEWVLFLVASLARRIGFFVDITT